MSGADHTPRVLSVLGLWRPLVTRSNEFWRAVARHRELLSELVKRDLKSGHAGHGLGSMWIYAQPLVVVGTFMLMFGVVIGSRVSGTESVSGDYAAYILIGIVPWLATANALGRAPTVFTANANLVKQVIFPIEILPVASALACFAAFAPAYALLLAYTVIKVGASPLMALLPLVMLLHALTIVGLILMLSVVTPFLRDVREFVAIYSAVSLYLTPAIYHPEWVPAALRPVLYCNPFSYAVWVYQDVLFYHEFRHPIAWAVMLAIALIVFATGLFVFRQAKKYLGNVL